MLGLLQHFIRYPFTNHFKVAIELGFENVRKEPALMPHWIKELQDFIRFDYEDERTDFFRQTKLFEVLIRNFGEGKPEYIAAFFPMAEFFLSTKYHIHKGDRKSVV